MNSNTPRILLAGGGTGGHIFPLIPVIRELKKRGAEVAFIGPEEFTLDAIREEQIPVRSIVRAGKFRRYFSFATLWDAVKLPIALLQCLRYIQAFKPHVLFGKGGYGTIAPVIAARLHHIPVVLHDTDLIPGLANRFLSRFAHTVLVSYSETKSYFPKKSTKLVGQPIRTNHLSMKKSEARRLLRFESSRRIIFFIGGSQGAQSINQAAKEAMGLLLKKYAVIASVGSGNIEYFKDINVNNALVVPFLNEKDLAAAYTLADIVVSRAGGSIFEIAAWGRPSILIPIPDGHQVANARAYEERGGAIVLEERELFGEGTPDVVKASQILAFAIESVLTNEEISSRLRRGAKEFAHIDAAERITTILLETAAPIRIRSKYD